MKNNYFIKALFVFAGPLVMSFPSQAFMPSWYIPKQGEYHKSITLEALDQIYAEYGYGPGLTPYTDSMNVARDNIAQSSADTDSNSSGLKTKPEYHCDDEQLNNCSNTVKSITDSGIQSIQNKEYVPARTPVGHVTHTLQDFYAHSNWVEMNGATVDPEMGYGNLSNLAAPDENTCTYIGNLDISASTLAVCDPKNQNNIVTHHLTSGYYKGEGIDIPAGISKCFHGGVGDGYGPQGINKDTAVCNVAGIVISPHAAWNGQAVTAARNATVVYFNNIKSRISDADFKQFLGFGAPSLGFTIDNTSSMSAALSSIKSAVTSIVNSRLGTNSEPANYVLGTINDPFVPAATETTDASVFVNKLNGMAIQPSYDGTCPELYGQGVYNAVSALNNNSTLFAYTDDTARDPQTARQASMLASSKGISIITSLSPSDCQLDGSSASYRLSNDNLYSIISEVTGGQIFNISSSEAGQLAQLSNILGDNYYTKLLSIDDTLSSGNSRTYDIPVDSTLDTLSITISLPQNANVTLLRPDGTAVGSGDAGVNVLSLSQMASYTIDQPAVGTWKVVVGGTGPFTVNVGGSSPLSFSQLHFDELEQGQDPGYFPIQGYPVAGVAQTVEATISGDTSDVQFEFRAVDGTLLGSAALNPVTVYPGVQTLFASENVNLPTQPFRVYAVGKDASGTPFERVLSNLIVPQTVAVTGPGDQNLLQGTDTTYTFKVTNYGAADSFTVAAVDDQGFVVGLSPTSVAIGTGETQAVSVTLNPGTASVGTVNTTTFMAIPASDPNALGNYAVVGGTVVDKLLDVPPPPPPAPPPPANATLPATPIPANDVQGLLALIGLLAGLAFWQTRRLKQRKG
jgi:hypothetical protein